MLKRLAYFTPLFASVFLLTPSASAQFNATVQGSVTDSTGAVIPDAVVTLTNNDTKKSQKTNTSGDGFYRFSGLAPGHYAVKAEKTGFKTQALSDVVVGAEAPAGVNIVLQPGEISQTVTVSAETTPLLDTENANIGGELTTQQIRRLPQLGRDPYELVRLSPNVTSDMARSGSGNSVGLPNTTGPGGSNSAIFQTENQVPLSANGQRLSSNNYEVDGVSVNSLGHGGAAVVTPNQESVKQVLVLTNPYNAEYGRNTGAQILVTSQNGTDQFHGSGFFKYDSPSLNAYNKYGGLNGALPTRDNDLYRQFGASLGGPILKDKLFFFGSYEGLRQSTNGSYTSWIETPQYRQQVVSLRPNGITAKIFQSAGIQPRIITTLPGTCAQAGFKAGQCQEVAGGLDLGSPNLALGQYTTDLGGGFDGVPDVEFAQLAQPATTEGNQYNGRIDYNPTSNDFIFASTYVTNLNNLGSDSGARSRPGADVYFKPINTAITAAYLRTLSPTLLNELRANFTRFADNQVSDSSSTDFGIPRIEVQDLPFSRIMFGAPQGGTTPGVFAQNTYEIRDTVNKVWGNHAMKYGVEIRREQDNSSLVGASRPDFVFGGLFNLANDAPIFETLNADPVTGAPADAQRYFRTNVYAGFVQDDWKIRPTFTLNVGLRWEYFSPLREKRGQLSNVFFPAPYDLADSIIAPTGEAFNPQKNNWEPRIGFAWSPPGLSNTVIRSGFGVFYDRIPDELFSNANANPPYVASYGICCGGPDNPFVGGQILYAMGTSRSPFSFPTNPKLAVGLNPSGVPNGPNKVTIWGAERDTPNPQAYVYSFQVEQKLPAQFVASAGYAGSVDHHLTRIVNFNYLYPNSPYSAVYVPQDDVNSTFNALILSLRRNFAQGVQVAANYKWSKSIDTLSYGGPGAVTNQTWPQDQSTERGPSDFDATHFFTLTGLWDLPIYRNQQGALGAILGGWELNGILTFHSGFPWTPKIGQSIQTPGGPSLAPTRPSVYYGGALYDTSNSAFINGTNFPACEGAVAQPACGAQYFNIATGGPPGIGRNVFRGPRFYQIDMSFVKRTKLPWLHLGEAASLELQGNFYNIFNQLNLTPLGFYSTGTFADQGFLGRADGALIGRVVDLQARFVF